MATNIRLSTDQYVILRRRVQQVGYSRILDGSMGKKTFNQISREKLLQASQQLGFSVPTSEEASYRQECIKNYSMSPIEATRATNWFARERGWGGSALTTEMDAVEFLDRDQWIENRRKKKAKKKKHSNTTDQSTIQPINLSNVNIQDRIDTIFDMHLTDLPVGTRMTVSISPPQGRRYEVTDVTG